jgi:hypothetical protein
MLRWPIPGAENRCTARRPFIILQKKKTTGHTDKAGRPSPDLCHNKAQAYFLAAEIRESLSVSTSLGGFLPSGVAVAETSVKRSKGSRPHSEPQITVHGYDPDQPNSYTAPRAE